MERKYIVYKHIFPNNKIYIGITKQIAEKRWKNGYGYQKGQYVRNAIEKYGWNNVKHEILFTNLTKEEAEKKEIELIKYYKSNNRNHGYNIANGGNCCGTVNEETKIKISQKNKGKSYHQSFWKGKKLSEKHREKLSESHKGKKNIITEETKSKISSSLKGHIVKKETRIKLGKKVICLDTGKIYNTAREAQEDTGIDYRGISMCCNNKRKSYKKTHWEFVNLGG